MLLKILKIELKKNGNTGQVKLMVPCCYVTFQTIHQLRPFFSRMDSQGPPTPEAVAAAAAGAAAAARAIDEPCTESLWPKVAARLRVPCRWVASMPTCMSSFGCT